MSKKYIIEKEQNRSPVDLTRFNPEQEYVCEDCDCTLLLYPEHLSAQHYPLERGPHYLCPICHMITDSSQYKPMALESVQPLDLSAPSFVIVEEDKGSNIVRPEPYDPEPNEEQWLKNIGATLISKKIQV